MTDILTIWMQNLSLQQSNEICPDSLWSHSTSVNIFICNFKVNNFRSQTHNCSQYVSLELIHFFELVGSFRSSGNAKSFSRALNLHPFCSDSLYTIYWAYQATVSQPQQSIKGQSHSVSHHVFRLVSRG